MSYGRLRNVIKLTIPIGITFLIVGVLLFTMNDAGTKSEKIGTVFMMYSGIILGIGFTALIALKTP